MHADVVVVGAGLVGLSTARRLLERTPELQIVVLDKEIRVATHQSGRNSGVVHAGLYYAPGSLKARLCREGRELLSAFCAELEIPITPRGKLVVAIDESELARLDELERRGTENGLVGLRKVSDAEIRDIEPHARGVRGLHVPESSVVDYGLVAQRLADTLTAGGVELVLGEQLQRVDHVDGAIRLRTRQRDIVTRSLVACAGLQADRVAALAGAPVDERIVPFRGDYWLLRGAAATLVRGLLYPVPDPSFPFLGVHFTPRHDGSVHAGPNAVPSLAREGYGRTSISPRDALDAVAWPGFLRLAARYGRTGALEIWRDLVKPAAVAEMRRYLPELRPADVARGPCGIRAQVMTRSGDLVDDFLVRSGPGSLHVINAPSPAATSCLAIGGLVAERAAEQFAF